MLVVDTSVWIDFLNGHRSAEADYLATCLASDVPIAMPGLVEAEILAGLGSDAEADKIASLLDACDPVPELASEDYRAAAAIFRACRRAGGAVGSVVDCLIAQACLRHGHGLLSKDRDFKRIASRTRLALVECG